jgi:hypothetical protein
VLSASLATGESCLLCSVCSRRGRLSITGRRVRGRTGRLRGLVGLRCSLSGLLRRLVRLGRTLCRGLRGGQSLIGSGLCALHILYRCAAGEQ